MARAAKPFKKESISIQFLIDQLSSTVGVELKPLNDVPLEERIVTESNLHRPGLVLAGYLDLFTHHRIQVLGNTETRYLKSLAIADRKKTFDRILAFGLPCIFLTENNKLRKDLLQRATKTGTPVFNTPLPTIDFMS
ncbi:MAG: HPr kinase/phosphorylase, partial [Rhodothermales bacterium]|nr:HPr kinase/phosphorylase [Rhodothermales bacterium]